ncbi:hypothetical protein [Halosegnis sp.]
MPECASCGESVGVAEEHIQLEHHHEHMRFESTFCGTDCAMAYLDDGLSG